MINRHPRARKARRWSTALADADARLFRRLVTRRSPPVDYGLWAASRAADRALLWLAIAALLASRKDRRGRRAAVRGVVAIGIASATVNGPLKVAWRRRRPRVSDGLPRRGLAPAPPSSSFPSGHAASAFAFATAASAELPQLTVPLGGLALMVAYSRIHTGVHYPGDVLAGAGVGVTAAIAARRLLDAADTRFQRKPPLPAGSQVPRRAVLVLNFRSGTAHRRERALRMMAESGIEIVEQVSIENVARVEKWVALAARDPIVIVAGGGDGTVGTVADYVANTEAVLAILPLGTSNDFARSIGVPTDPAAAARLLVTGKVSTIDAGRLVVPGGISHHFVHAATVGVNVSFAKLATKASMRERFGRLTYVLAAAAALGDYQPFACELYYDGRVERLELVHLAVINAPVFGGFLGMRISGASVADRKLDVIAVEHLRFRRLLLAATHPIAGVRREIPGIRTLRVPELRVHSAHVLDVALDGEVLGRIPADFEVAGEGLRVVTPPDFEAR